MISLLKTGSVLLLLLLTTSVVARPKCPSVRRVDFMNRVYPLNEDGFTRGTQWLRVTGGRYEEPHEQPLSLSYLYFQVHDVVFGDLTGDGQDEAAVVALYGSASGSFHLTDTYIFGCAGGRVRLIGVVKQNRIERDSELDVQEAVKKPVRIKGNTVHVKYGVEGFRASPQFFMTFRYKLVGGKLRARGRVINRREY